MLGEKNIKVLVADDDPEMRDYISGILEDEGFSVTQADDGEKAYNILKKLSDIKIIVCDIRMPGIDGMEVLKKGLVVNPFLKVILITAYGELEQYLEIMNMGAFEYLNKPFTLYTFLDVISRAVNSLGKEKENPQAL